MEKQSTGRVKMKLVVSVLALLLLMTCGVFMGACKSTHGENDHSYTKSTSENVAATCGSTGYDVYVCSCGVRYAVPTYATGKHNFSNGYCTVCGLPDTYDDAELKTLLDSINAKVSQVNQSLETIHKHNFSGDTITVDATCYASGFVAKKCECGSSAIVSSIDKLDHEWAKENIIVPATCTDVGEVYRKCVNCDATVLYQTIPVAGHKFGSEMEVIVPATCTTEGYKAYRCSECGETSYTQVIPATEHKMEWRTKNTKGYEAEYAANCQHGERTWYHCVNDNCPVDWGEPTEIGSKGTHIFDVTYEGNEVITPASCTSPAILTLKCMICGESGDQATGKAALGHEWERTNEDGTPAFDWSKVDVNDTTRVTDYVAATCSTVGSFNYKCADCDAVYQYIIPVAPNAHSVQTDASGNPKLTETYSQLSMILSSETHDWNTVTYTHYICSLCHGWLVKTVDIPEGYDPTDPTKIPQPEPTQPQPTQPGDQGTGDSDPAEGIVAFEDATTSEYTLIPRFTFDYEHNYKDTLKAWAGEKASDGSVVRNPIIQFSWHSWRLYDNVAKDYANNGAQKNDFGEDVQIGDVTCTTDGLHYYHCIEHEKEHTQFVITPAIGHNYDVPNTIEEFYELYKAEGNGIDGSAPEGGWTMEKFGEREDNYIGADCTQYGILFLSCTNCFVKESNTTGTIYSYYGSVDEYKTEHPKTEGEVEGDNTWTDDNTSKKVLDCYDIVSEKNHGSNNDTSRVAVTVRKNPETGVAELVTITLSYALVKEEGTDSSYKITKFKSDDAIAAYIRSNPAADAYPQVEYKEITESAINGRTVEKLYAAFLGLDHTPTTNATATAPQPDEVVNYGDKFKQVTDTFTTTYVFDPLGHVWVYAADGEEQTSWTVIKTPVAADGETLEADETFDCTKRGYTGRYCSRACDHGTKEYSEGDDTTPADAPNKYDLHQKIELRSGTREEVEADETLKDRVYWLGTLDKEGLEYFLYAVETDKCDKDQEALTVKTRKADLSYTEYNRLFALLREKEHAFVYLPVDPDSATCGSEVDVDVKCKNIGCNVHHKQQTIELDHLGRFGQYTTIGACGTAYGEDHSIITYDYCLDCGKRVGRELLEVRDDAGELLYNDDGSVKKELSTEVVWTEGEIHLGKFVDVLPSPGTEIGTNYRHFPFNREMIENLISGAKIKYSKDSEGNPTISADIDDCNYKLYAYVWQLIDYWYATNDDAVLRSTLLSAFLMTNDNHGYTNGWTARCHDCYVPYFTDKCSACNTTTDHEGEAKTHYFVLTKGNVVDCFDASSATLLWNMMVEDAYVKELGLDPNESFTLDEEKWDEVEGTLLEKYFEEETEDPTFEDGDVEAVVKAYMETHKNATVYSADIYGCTSCWSYIWYYNDETGNLFDLYKLSTPVEP